MIQFEIVVLDVSERMNPPLFDVGYRPIYPHDLELPIHSFRNSRYRITKTPDRDTYQVVDTRDGRELSSYSTRLYAGDAIALLERGLSAEAALKDGEARPLNSGVDTTTERLSGAA